jgi:ketosteroid isomerase-like protein
LDRATERVLAGLRDGIASWNAGSLEAAPEIWHEDIVWVEPGTYPDGGTHHGRDACVARMRERLDLLGSVQIELLGGELRGRRMLVEADVRGAGAASGAPAENREYWIYEFAADGRIIRWLEFLSREPALAALEEGAGA